MKSHARYRQWKKKYLLRCVVLTIKLISMICYNRMPLNGGLLLRPEVRLRPPLRRRHLSSSGFDRSDLPTERRTDETRSFGNSGLREGLHLQNKQVWQELKKKSYFLFPVFLLLIGFLLFTFAKVEVVNQVSTKKSKRVWIYLLLSPAKQYLCTCVH